MNINDYPIGADISDAPWNVKGNEVKTFWANVSQNFFRQTLIETNKYDDEESVPKIPQKELEELYYEQSLNPKDLLERYRDLLIDLKHGKVPTHGSEIDFLISECNEWIVGCEDTSIEQEY